MTYIYIALAGFALLFLHNLMGKPPLSALSHVIRLALGTKTLLREWQVGDGREEDCAKYVLKHAKAGDIHDAIRTIDKYAYQKKFLINVGDKKGAILDRVIQKARPKRVMELGAYVGYSALRIASQLPQGGHLFSIEFNPANAEIARRIVAHAGAADKITFINGRLGDGGKTLNALRDQYGFSASCLDVIFIDHAKEAYLPDLQSMLSAQWLHSGTVVVADNVRFPGAPEYKSYMEKEEG